MYPKSCSRLDLYVDPLLTVACKAADQFYNSWTVLKTMDDNLGRVTELYQQCELQYMQVIIFSADCIEAFLNDYLAVSYGDKLFSDSFVKLDNKGKLQLVALVSEQKTLDKLDGGQTLLTNIEGLIKARNKYIHPKSQPFNENKKGELDSIEFSPDSDKYCQIMVSEYKKEVNHFRTSILNALQAIYRLMKFIDFIDMNRNACQMFFDKGNIPNPDKDFRRSVLQQYKIIP